MCSRLKGFTCIAYLFCDGLIKITKIQVKLVICFELNVRKRAGNANEIDADFLQLGRACSRYSFVYPSFNFTEKSFE